MGVIALVGVAFLVAHVCILGAPAGLCSHMLGFLRWAGTRVSRAGAYWIVIG